VFLLLGLGTLLVAGWMAVMLSLSAEAGYYYFVFSPLIVGAPALGALWLACRYGECRSPLAAGVLALLAAVTFYVGYWEVSYVRTVRRLGPESVQTIEEIGGAPGLPGYFLFRCKTDIVSKSRRPRPHRAFDEWSLYFLTGLDVLVVSMAVAAGRRWGRAAYDETEGEWAKAVTLIYHPDDLETLVAAVEREDWRPLGDLPKILGGWRQGKEKTRGALVTLEYFPRDRPMPMYVSLSGPMKFKQPLDVAKWLVGARPYFFRQKRVSAGSAAVLRDEVLLPDGPARREPAIEYAGNPAAAPEVEHDFRADAVAESRAIMDPAQGTAARRSASLCLSLDSPNVPLPEAGPPAWRSLVILGGLLGATFASDTVLTWAGVGKSERLTIFFVLAMSALAGPVLDDWITVWTRDRRVRARMARQRGSLLDAAKPAEGFEFNVWNFATYHLNPAQPDDYVFCQLDPERGRLLLEGLRYRYVIRDEDLIGLTTVEGDTRESLEISFMVGSVPLRLVLSRRSGAGAAVHAAWWRWCFPRRDANWLVDRLWTALKKGKSD
jgi:hypothetical protein